MKPDKITETVIQDPLLIFYGENLLKNNKKKKEVFITFLISYENVENFCLK